MNTEYWDAQIKGFEEAFRSKKKVRLDRLFIHFWEEE
tara:strand:- start:75 stop:185 length:111 start_codon:yes stop_codon:yes gene_type:complete